MNSLDWLTARPIAHRGYHDLNTRRWENTLPAFTAAIDNGFAIECDVVLSADRVPMVFHDHTLERLTGAKGSVADRTAANLQELVVGGTDDRIPTLDAMLEYVDGRVPLVIELKGEEGRDEGFVATVGACLAGYKGQAAIMSFSQHLVRRFSVDAPGIPAGLTAMGSNIAAMERHFAMLAHDIAFASYYVGEVDNRFVAFIRGTLGLPVITWTVRTKANVAETRAHADQMTFEGFDPSIGPAA